MWFCRRQNLQPPGSKITMDVDPTEYVRRRFLIKAVQVTADNMAEVADWCGGVVVNDDKPHISVPIRQGQKRHYLQAFISDWVTFAGPSCKIYNNSAFIKCFEENVSHPFDEATAERLLKMLGELKGALITV